MLDAAEDEVWQPLTTRDTAVVAGLKQGPLATHTTWTDELEIMLEWGRKAEIEALYNISGFDGFAETLAEALLQQDWLE